MSQLNNSAINTTDDLSAEQKIKAAARKLFTERGFEAVKTRDIATEAGINIALLNYYFRSKQKLFDIVMMENFKQFIDQLTPILSNKEGSLDEVMAMAATRYIDMLKGNPDLPFFILKESRGNNGNLDVIKENTNNLRENFTMRLATSLHERGTPPDQIAHFLLNFMSLLMFPFVAKPLIMKINGFSESDFNILMEQRKELLPIWFNAILKTPINNNK